MNKRIRRIKTTAFLIIGATAIVMVASLVFAILSAVTYTGGF